MTRWLTQPTILLRLEGGTALAIVVALYATHGAGWLLFALLILAPDLSALGYLAGPRIGAACYNAAHTYVGPAVLGAAGVAAGSSLAVALALIWAAHIGGDRLLGYGLKLPDSFQSTHLGPMGKRSLSAQVRAAMEKGSPSPPS